MKALQRSCSDSLSTFKYLGPLTLPQTVGSFKPRLNTQDIHGYPIFPAPHRLNARQLDIKPGKNW